MGGEATALKALDGGQAEALARICELVVPGSGRAGSIVYVDALLAGMPAPAREHFVEAIDELGEVARGGADALAAHAATPGFLGLRALAIEAYYSDFVAPGHDAPGAWAEIDFRPPLAARLDKDWSFLGIGA